MMIIEVVSDDSNFETLKLKMAVKDVKLPSDVKNRILRGTHYSSEERNEIYNKFVQNFLKLNKEDPENFAKVVVHLDKPLDKKPNKQTNDITSKKLTYRKRKALGLYHLGKKSLKYRSLLPLHKLWKEYMMKYMNLDEIKKQNWTNSCDDPNFEQVSLKLFRADYHGSKMTVLKSTCPSYVGKSGIVAMETKNCFKILGRDNLIRTIPKVSCVFTFKLEGFEFIFYGKNLQSRPADRSSKKLKTIYTSDLQL